jgi:hypothetical protein
MDPLIRLRGYPDYDGLSEPERVAVLDAADLLDELRPKGYRFAPGPDGTLRVRPPAGADKEARARVAALAGALLYVLRAEAEASPEAGCAACGAAVARIAPDDGRPLCRAHFREARARALLRAADAHQATAAAETMERGP